MLRIEVYEDAELLRAGQAKLPGEQNTGYVNTPVAKERIAGWAAEHELSYFEQPPFSTAPPKEFPAADVFLRMQSANDRGILDLSVLVEDRRQIDDLLAQLASLPGVHPTIVWPGMSIDVSGYTMVAPGFDVRIDGQEYRCPEDFTLNEQQTLFGPVMNHFSSMGWTDTSYYAYFTLDHTAPDRFDLGDIVRVHWDGSVVSIDTLVEDWGLSAEQITQVLDAPNRAWGLSDSGATRIEGDYSATGTVYAAFFLPHGVDEADIDVRAEFERRLNPLPQDIHEPRYSVTLMYDLIAPELLQTRRAVELAADPLPEQVAAEAQVRLDAWLAEHPQYRRGLAFSQPVKLLPHRSGELLTRLRLSVQTDESALADELAALMSGIEGLPEPRVTVRDRDE